MASIRKKDTAPEIALRQALWSAGVRGWRCHAGLPGTPDLAFPRWRLAVMVDGVWWHGHPDHLPTERHSRYWHEKIARNVERDRRVNADLTRQGWRVIRVWDLDVLSDPASAVDAIITELRDLGWQRT
jgi:DNA mismatch endonuclease (patch repair protein)